MFRRWHPPDAPHGILEWDRMSISDKYCTSHSWEVVFSILSIYLMYIHIKYHQGRCLQPMSSLEGKRQLLLVVIVFSTLVNGHHPLGEFRLINSFEAMHNRSVFALKICWSLLFLVGILLWMDSTTGSNKWARWGGHILPWACLVVGMSQSLPRVDGQTAWHSSTHFLDAKAATSQSLVHLQMAPKLKWNWVL